MFTRKTARQKKLSPEWLLRRRLAMEDSKNMQKPDTSERKLSTMVVMLISLLVGIVIGVIFKSLKLPVPVPHDFSGIIGLIGMFVGSALVDVVAKLLAK